MSQKVLLLYNNKKAFLQVTRLTSHGNYHSTIDNYSDICYLIKLLTKDSVFYE